MTPADWLTAAQQTIGKASAAGQAICIRGHASKDFYGEPSHGATILETTGYEGIVDYDPTELVVVARCGTPISTLESTLSASRQMLAFEPPRFKGKGTIGGMVAAGLSGPRRVSVGAVKDFILGMTVMDASANLLRYGGTVMKNVAGYDLSRLHTGALGTLGLILDLSIKVLPMPPAQASLRFEMSAGQAIDAVNRWGGQPLPISATSWRGGELIVRLSGADAAVKSAIARMGGEELPEQQADGFWNALRDQEDDFFDLNYADPSVMLWRISVPSLTAPIKELGEDVWMEWGCGLRWLKTNLSAALIREHARACGGHAVLYRAASDEARRTIGAFAELPPAIMKIHHRLKMELDPNRLFNPGRMYAAL